MPRVKVDYVVSFSSEDPENPASNLLSEEISGRPWLCGARGEASASVVLQLARSVRISAVHVGSRDSALVEVLVGRSETPNQPYQVLVLSSIFMSPAESKRGPGADKVRTFGEQQLAAEARAQRWDRVRVVCLQPYNKHVKYGLSFIHIFEPETSATLARPAPAPALPVPSQRFQIRASPSSDEEDTFQPGELFAKLRNETSQPSVDAQIRQASKPAGLKNVAEFLPKVQSSRDKTKHSDGRDPEHIGKVSRDRDNLFYKDEEKPNERIDKIMKRDKEQKDKIKLENNIDNKMKDSYHNKDERRRKNKESNGEQNKEKSHKKHEKSVTSQPDSKLKDNSHRNENKRTHSSDSGVDRTTSRRDLEKKDKNIEKERNSRHDSDRNKTRDSNGEPSSSRHANKRPHSSDKDSASSSKRAKAAPDDGGAERAGARPTSPHRLLADVVCVLSGYVNPRRAALRDRALAMGARYRQDWGPGCTHLICAFSNTPKLRAVRASDPSAIVVTGDWVEECCRAQRRVPWRWHATQPEQRRPRDAGGVAPRASRSSSEDCDTDDEIQKVLDKQKNTKVERKSPESKSPSASKVEPPPSPSESRGLEHASQDSDVSFVRDERIKGKISISDSDTDAYTDEETVPTDATSVTIDKRSCLADFFEGYTFAIDPGVRQHGFDPALLKRYITAYSGQVVEHVTASSDVSYVLSMDVGCEVWRVAGAAAAVRPDWVWRCTDHKKKVSTEDFLLK